MNMPLFLRALPRTPRSLFSVKSPSVVLHGVVFQRSVLYIVERVYDVLRNCASSGNGGDMPVAPENIGIVSVPGINDLYSVMH